MQYSMKILQILCMLVWKKTHFEGNRQLVDVMVMVVMVKLAVDLDCGKLAVGMDWIVVSLW
jgi:hypothetical protein